MPRDPLQRFTTVRTIVELAKPLDALFLLIERMRADEVSNRAAEHYQAVYWRDRLLVELLTSNPLRVNNIALLTWRQDNSGQLYQGSGGKWFIRIPPDGFKNTLGAAKAEYNVPVNSDVVPTLEKYLRHWRRRLNNDTADLDYVFLPMRAADSTSKVTRSWRTESISTTLSTLTHRYIPELAPYGFRAHGFRHIVATDWIKNHEEGYEMAARILHNTPAVVRLHYSWVKTGEFHQAWIDYSQKRRAAFLADIAKADSAINSGGDTAFEDLEVDIGSGDGDDDDRPLVKAMG